MTRFLKHFNFKRISRSFPLFLFLLAAIVIFGQEGENDEEIIPSQVAPRLPEYVWSVAWNPNGKSIALGIGPNSCGATNNDYSVRILDTDSGLIVSHLIYHQCAVKDLDWSPDGSILVSTGEGAVVWDMNTQQPISVFSSEHMPGSLDISWSPDGTKIASTASADPFVRLWNPVNGQIISTFNSIAPSSIAWSPNGKKLAVGGNNITVWNPLESQLLLTFRTGPIGKIMWSPDGNKLAGVDSDYNIRVFDALTGTLLRMLQGHASNIEKIAWSPNSISLASASRDGTVRIWDVETGYQFNIFSVTAPVYSVTWNPDGTKLAYGGTDNDNQVVIVSPNFSAIPTPTYSP